MLIEKACEVIFKKYAITLRWYLKVIKAYCEISYFKQLCQLVSDLRSINFGQFPYLTK